VLRVADRYADTDLGQARRGNEDAFFVQPPLFVVADGMGGAQAGEVASGIAVDTFRKGLPDGGDRPEFRLAQLVHQANRQIHERSRTAAEQAGMGTTLTAAYVDVDGVAIAHVGDSRAYRWRAGDLERLTDDHSLVEELIRQGKLTAEEAEDHPQRSIITRALGPEPDVDVDTRTAPARDGDLFLLCSDGLTGMIGEAGVARVLREGDGGTLRDLVRALIAAANAAGGRDNITVVLFRVEEVDDLPEGAPETEQHTTITRDEPTTGAVRAAVADADAARVEPRVARPRAQAPKKRRNWGKRLTVALILFTILGAIAIGVYAAMNSVYFVGTDDQGRVALYRGLPYELPLGVDLYTLQYRSGIPADSLTPARRDTLLDHKLRAHADAVDLVRQLELGQLQGS
jgi:PPM family protein phosphatase